MKKALIAIGAVILTLLLVGFAVLYKYGPYYGIYIIKPSASRYVKISMTYCEYGYLASTDEWKKTEADILDRASDIKTFDEAHALLDEAAKAAGGPSSKIVPPEDVGYEEEDRMPSLSLDSDGILYVDLEPIFNPDNIREYSNTVVDYYKEHQSEVKGVILDYRDINGMNIVAAMGAISPFVNDGTQFSFRAPGLDTPVAVRDGVASTGGGYTVSVDPVKADPSCPIAILQDENTVSAAEMSIVAFEDKDNVRTFGHTTAGACNSLNPTMLYDGAVMYVVVGPVVTKSGKEILTDGLAPDVETVTSKEAYDAAREWLLSEIK